MLICASALLATAVASAASDAQTKVVTFDPASSILWKTATSYPAKVSLLWPAGAASATLEMSPGGSVNITDTSLDFYELSQVAPVSEQSEKVVRLTLTYRDENGVVLESQSATVGFVCGTVATSDIAWRTPGKRSWARSKMATPVIPVPEDVTALAVDGQALDVSEAPTWACLLGNGVSHKVSWTKGGVAGEQTYKMPQGLFVICY